ncbi:hypothetical protein [Priestia megaterium]|uniref:hypothetical protein n=1 Tax=Priestia megaterium TaxID=1404 RepID=UPI00301301F5
MNQEWKLDYLTDIHKWFLNLEDEELEAVFKKVEQGMNDFIDYIDNNFSDMIIPFTSLIDFLSTKLKKIPEKEMVSYLAENGIQNAFAKNLVKQVMNSISIYFAAEKLRSVSNNEFEYILDTIINDMFIARRYRSLKKLAETLKWDDVEEAQASYFVIRNILSGFYKQNASIDDINDVLIELIEFPSERIPYINKLFTEEKIRERLERFFLFDQLSDLNDELSKIYLTLDNL